MNNDVIQGAMGTAFPRTTSALLGISFLAFAALAAAPAAVGDPTTGCDAYVQDPVATVEGVQAVLRHEPLPPGDSWTCLKVREYVAPNKVCYDLYVTVYDVGPGLPYEHVGSECYYRYDVM